jgi:AbrB family looped-hinge helix DNA binding protein
MEISTITTKGQVVIPAKLRKRYGLKSGTKVAFIEKNDEIIMKLINKNYFISLIGSGGTKGKALRSLMEDKKSEREL